MTISWHTTIDFEPPIVGCSINIPTAGLAARVVNCGNGSVRELDKLGAHWTTLPLCAKDSPLGRPVGLMRHRHAFLLAPLRCPARAP